MHTFVLPLGSEFACETLEAIGLLTVKSLDRPPCWEAAELAKPLCFGDQSLGDEAVERDFEKGFD